MRYGLLARVLYFGVHIRSLNPLLNIEPLEPVEFSQWRTIHTFHFECADRPECCALRHQLVLWARESTSRLLRCHQRSTEPDLH